MMCSFAGAPNLMPPTRLGERGAHRVIDDVIAAVLSEIRSNSPRSLPKISTTACEVASSRVIRWFSARSRSGSSFPPAPLARCALRGGIAPNQRVASDRPLPDLGPVQALTPPHRRLAAVRRRRILGDHPGPIRRSKRAAHRTRRRIGHCVYRADHQMVTGTGGCPEFRGTSVAGQ